MSISHAELCEKAVRWLRFANSRGGHGCQVALSEPRTGYLGGEVPDAIGFRISEPGLGSVVIECKVSRSDFRADAKKPHRGASGMGRYRYFLCPDGMLEPAEIPDRWGLLVMTRRGSIRALRGPAAELPVHSGQPRWPRLGEVLVQWEHERDAIKESLLLTSVLSRVGDVEAVNRRIREADARAARLAHVYERARQDLANLRAEHSSLLYPARRHEDG